MTITALMPGARDTNFFHRAGTDDTKVAMSEKDDPADVAKTGFDALMAGHAHVVAGFFENKVQATRAHVLPDTMTADIISRRSPLRTNASARLHAEGRTALPIVVLVVTGEYASPISKLAVTLAADSIG